ncbi:hypothetical protein [Actinomadura xylanilytica]|uniref:hypothetical protein n=1 Tax=Actinomadura xylanilytica TaxID=887459 RepID=UPI00255B2912|nr:hypothetical protein [Actinomadura xylanilytica]MDL4773611.1 hypothetical protein [Actinomadura xylanilytica]
MRVKRTLALMGAGAAAMASIAMTAPPASASDGQEYAKKGSPSHDYWLRCTTRDGAFGCFQPYGEYFYIKDIEKEGESPFVQWKSSTGRSGTITAKVGYMNWGYVNKSFDESTTITFRSCVLVCSKWTSVSAGYE